MGLRGALEPSGGTLLRLLEALRRPGETLVETARREAIAAALDEARGKQTDAARIMHMTPRVLNYWMEDLRLRPKDHI